MIPKRLMRAELQLSQFKVQIGLFTSRRGLTGLLGLVALDPPGLGMSSLVGKIKHIRSCSWIFSGVFNRKILVGSPSRGLSRPEGPATSDEAGGFRSVIFSLQERLCDCGKDRLPRIFIADCGVVRGEAHKLRW